MRWKSFSARVNKKYVFRPKTPEIMRQIEKYNNRIENLTFVTQTYFLIAKH